MQDLFTSGVIKSATDFQVYKEIAGLSGLDFAYVDNTAVYHTKVSFSPFWFSFLLSDFDHFTFANTHLSYLMTVIKCYLFRIAE
jgi:hypothetical protein